MDHDTDSSLFPMIGATKEILSLALNNSPTCPVTEALQM